MVRKNVAGVLTLVLFFLLGGVLACDQSKEKKAEPQVVTGEKSKPEAAPASPAQTNPEVKPATPAEAKPEAKPEGATANPTEAKPENAPASPTEAKPEAKPEGVTANPAEAKPENAPASPTEAKPEAKPEGATANPTEAKPENAPASPTEAKPEGATPAGKATAPADQSGGNAPKDELVATVNGVPISKAAFEKEMGLYEQQMSRRGQKPAPEQVAEQKEKLLENLIDRELLKQEVEKEGVKIEPADVDKQIAALKKQFPSEADFAKALATNHKTEQQVREDIAQNWRLKLNKMLDQQVLNKIVVSDEEVKAFYDANLDKFKTPEKIRASHILVKVDAKATPEEKAKAREKLEGIQKKILAGGDFAALAKESSDCPSKEKGGDLDYFARGQMVKPFEDTAFGLKPGAMSGIVETEFGYHLIKVTDKKDAGLESYDEVKEKIRGYLKREKSNQAVEKYVEQLKASAKIEKFKS